MNALWKKEIRLLLPAWIVVMGLALIPPWLIDVSIEVQMVFVVFLVYAGLVMMAIGSFGLELSYGTWPGLLAQPMARDRIWWTKLAVLFFASLLSFGALFWSYNFRGVPWGEARGLGEISTFWRVVGVGGSFALAGVAGGLWTTLLMRHVSGALWIALLVPVAIGMAVFAWFPVEATEATIARATGWALGIYAVLGVWWARRLFLRAQDAAWTGGTLTPPSWMLGSSRLRSFMTGGDRKSVV